MGTDVHVVVVADVDRGDELCRDAEARVRAYEARWSRFVPTSELSRLNAAAGSPVLLPADTFALVALAISAWRQTDGWFDPTVLEALEAAGYDRSYEDVVGKALRSPEGQAARPVQPVPGPDAIALDAQMGEVVLPRGVRLDLGGIGKGHTADLVATGLLTRGAEGALVNMGGDLRAVGRPSVGDAWVVATDATPPVEVAITAGAVATSTTTKRRWTVENRPMHHLIDPHTGAPSTSALETVTVVAGTAAWAEVLAKVVLLAGLEIGGPLLARSGVTGIAIAADGTVTRLAGFDAYERLRG